MGRFRFFRGSTQTASHGQKANSTTVEDPLHGHEKYSRLSDLNSGTFGFVLKALDKITKQTVAIKLLPRGSSIHNGVEREILNHRALQHPHVIQFKEVFLTEKYLAIVMEYADREDLFRFVKDQGRLREDLARWMFQQIIFGVDYCHRRGVANRDIKLENVLLKSGARRPLVKLCDFGYSKHEDWDSAPKSRVGTPDYMSPEIFHSKNGAYDGKKADLWSCGVVLYTMVVGQYPFSRKEDQNLPAELQHQVVLQRVVKGNYSLPGYLSEECTDLIQRLLDPDPQTRITIPEIIHHSWHRIGLPAEAEHMNDVYLSASRVNGQCEEAIRSMVSKAMNKNNNNNNNNSSSKELVSDQMIDWAMGEEEEEEEQFITGHSGKKLVEEFNAQNTNVQNHSSY
eukprot:g4059.t1